MTEPLSPYALSEPVFPFRALAQAAARAPLGGAREALVATLVAVRLAVAAVAPEPLAPPLRSARGAAARHWLGALSLSAAVRHAVVQLVEASVSGEPAAIAAALAKVIEVTAPHLDKKARYEIERIAPSPGAAPVLVGRASILV